MPGRRIIAATAPSSAMMNANASAGRSAGTVEPSHSTKPISGKMHSLTWVRKRLKVSRRRAALRPLDETILIQSIQSLMRFWSKAELQ